MKHFNKLFLSLVFLLTFSFSNQLVAQTCSACQFLPVNTIIVIPNDGIYQCTGGNSCILLVVLPIELTNFEGALQRESVQIKWETASETDNKGFEVERSFDGKDFYTIDFIEGAGTSTQTINYTFTDENIRKNALGSTAYYRLKQIDYDGTVAYTDMVAIDLKIEVAAFEVTSITYPSQKQLEVFYQTTEAGNDINIFVSDMNGRAIRNIIVTPENGFNTLSLDLSDFQAGIYVLSFMNQEQIISKKVLIH